MTGVCVSGRGGIEREAKREFERAVLGQIVSLCPEGEPVPVERGEQAIGYYRHCEDGNPVQQVLGRRLRAALIALQSERALARDTPADCLVLTAHGRELYTSERQPWWRRPWHRSPHD